MDRGTSVWIIANLCLAWLRCSTSVAARWTCSLKIEFSFLNCNLMVPGGSSAYLLVDDQRQPNKPLEVLMKRYLGAVAAAALLVGTMAVATDALAAGHGGGGGGDSVAATWAVGSAGHCWKASLRCHHRSSIHRVHTLCLPRPRPQSRRQARGQYLGMAETILNFQKNYEQAPPRDFQPLRHVI